MQPTRPKIGAAAWSTSSYLESTMTTTACIAETAHGRLSMSPMAPSSSWWAIRTTVLRKFGSTSTGDETRRFPWSESTSSEMPRLAIGKRAKDPFGDDLAVDLVGPVVDATAPGEHHHARERRLVGQPAGAVHLHRAVDHVLEHLRREELDRRDLDARLVARVDLVRRVERHQPAGL